MLIDMRELNLPYAEESADDPHCGDERAPEQVPLLGVPEEEDDARRGNAEKSEPAYVAHDFDKKGGSDKGEKQNTYAVKRGIVVLAPASPKRERINDGEKNVDCEVLCELGECAQGERRRKPQTSTFLRRQCCGVAYKADLKVPEFSEADRCEDRRTKEKPCDSAGEEQKGFLF